MKNIPFAAIAVFIICLLATSDIYRGMVKAKYTGRACGNVIKYPKGDCQNATCFEACKKTFGTQFGYMQGFCPDANDCMCWWPCRPHRQSHIVN